MSAADDVTRRRHAAENEAAKKRAIAKLTAACAGTGMEVCCPTVMVERQKDRVDVFPRVSMKLSDLLREDSDAA